MDADFGEVRWDKLHALVVRERAAMGVWRWLAAREGGGAPAEWRDRLRALALATEFRQRRLLVRLEEAVGRLADRDIEVVLLKGAALAHTVYASPLHRSMYDLDLLVPGGRGEEAREVLRDAGWDRERDGAPDSFYQDHPHLPPLRHREETSLVLELHTDLFVRGHPFLISAQRLRRGASDVELGSHTAPAPEPVIHLVYLCLHFAWAHVFSRGGWRTVWDVAALTRSPAFEWARFVEAARESRGGTCCYWTLRLARHLGGVDVPGPVLGELRPRMPALAADVLERHLLLQLFLGEGTCPSVKARQALWRMAIQPVRSGHGSSRPWARSRAFAEAHGSDTEPALWRRAADQLGSLPRWWAYVGELAGAGRESLGERDRGSGAA